MWRGTPEYLTKGVEACWYLLVKPLKWLLVGESVGRRNLMEMRGLLGVFRRAGIERTADVIEQS